MLPAEKLSLSPNLVQTPKKPDSIKYLNLFIDEGHFLRTSKITQKLRKGKQNEVIER